MIHHSFHGGIFIYLLQMKKQKGDSVNLIPSSRHLVIVMLIFYFFMFDFGK